MEQVADTIIEPKELVCTRLLFTDHPDRRFVGRMWIKGYTADQWAEGTAKRPDQLICRGVMAQHDPNTPLAPEAAFLIENVQLQEMCNNLHKMGFNPSPRAQSDRTQQEKEDRDGRMA